MNTFLVIGIFISLFCILIQFARQEHIQEDYEEAVIDIEGRLDWAHSRTSFPFGMKAQLEVSYELLGKAKTHWKENKWNQAYQFALQSQEAMNKAQKIYVSALTPR